MATLGPMQDMGIDFKHLGVLARPHTLRNLVLHSCINQKLVRNSGTWHGVMAWLICVLMINCLIWDKFWHKPLQTSSTHGKLAFVVSIRNASPYVGESTSAASSRLELYISRGNIYQNECRAKISNYTWFVWTFYTLIDFYMHYLICIIQI